MLRRILSQVSNSKAKKQDDWWFHEEPLNNTDTMDVCVITKIRGYLEEPLFYLKTLTVISVLSIGLQISRTAESTSVESTFGLKESLELQLRIGRDEELQLRVTGKNTTEVVQSLKMILLGMEKNPSKEKSYLSTEL